MKPSLVGKIHLPILSPPLRLNHRLLKMNSDFDLSAHFRQLPDSVAANIEGIAFGLILLVLLIGLAIVKSRKMKSGKKWHAGTYSKWNSAVVPFKNAQPNMADPKNQMEAIAASGFETCRLLNKEEARVLPVLERSLRKANQGHRVMAQTSLGEMIRPKNSGAAQINKRAFAPINSKRLDFAVINKFGILVCAIEYQGTGHYHKTSFMRDAVKREVLRKSGVPFLEVPPDFTPQNLERQLFDAIGFANQEIKSSPSRHSHAASRP